MQRQPAASHFNFHPNNNAIAYILSLAEFLSRETRSQSTFLKLSIMMTAIEEFEENRMNDYYANKTKRTLQVLNSIDIFRKLYRSKLSESVYHEEAKELKSKLTRYADSVEDLLEAIDKDIALYEELDRNKQLVADQRRSRSLMDAAHLAAAPQIDYTFNTDENDSTDPLLPEGYQDVTFAQNSDDFNWVDAPLFDTTTDSDEDATEEEVREDKFEFDFDATSSSSRENSPRLSRSNSSSAFFSDRSSGYDSDSEKSQGLSRSNSDTELVSSISADEDSSVSLYLMPSPR